MILKILPRHNPSYASLISYILKEGKGMNEKPEVITHNLRSRTPREWVQEYKTNEAFRKQSRKDQVHLYHDILSLSANEDTSKVTKEMLHDIANRYIQLRGYDGMYVGAVHREKDHIHIHFCTSGLKFRTGEAFRLSREQMQTVKRELQEYHKQKYPELTESMCKHGAGKNYVTNKAWHAVHKGEQKQMKDELMHRVQNCFSNARSQKDFISNLTATGISAYERNGIPTGVTYQDTKFRFTRLGIDMKELPPVSEKEKNNNHMERKHNKTEQDVLKELHTLREEKHKEERGVDKELITEHDGQTNIVTYNNLMKETVTRNSDGTETVRYERIGEEEREHLDDLAEKTTYYTDHNEFINEGPDIHSDSLDEFDNENEASTEVDVELDELDSLREEANDERDLDEIDRDDNFDER